jgi:hypothetical protein
VFGLCCAGSVSAALVEDAQAAPGTRAYELVSPIDKNGYPVYFYQQLATGLTRASSDGNAVVFQSWGTFAGARSGMPTSYRSRRTADGWVISPVSPPPATQVPQALTLTSTWLDSTLDTSVGIVPTQDFFDPSDVNDARDVYVQHVGGQPVLVSRGDGPERTGPTGATYVGMSRDGARIAFQTDAHLVPGDAGRVTGEDAYVREGGRTQLLNTDANGALLSACGSSLGAGVGGRAGAISSDGSRVVFQVPNGFGDPSCDVQRVFVRDGAEVLDASASRRTPADPGGARPATYRGASADGGIVVLASEEMLTDDAPAGGGLYAFRPGSNSLDFIQGTDAGGVQLGGFVALSEDGGRVFFVSRRQVLPGFGEEGRENLYVNDRGVVRWLATNSSDIDPAAMVAGPATPDESVRIVDTTPTGAGIAFATTAKLTDYDNVDPDSGTPRREVYFASIEADGSARLVCVSCDPAGQRPPGAEPRSNAALSDATVSEQVMSDDARAVFFTTADQLVTDDTNQRRDVYEYADGAVRLVSSGRSVADSYLVGASSDGVSVFFGTVDSLVASDQDGGNLDIYAARIGGGFSQAIESPASGCDGDACQGPPTPMPSLPQVSSDAVTGDGDAPVARAPSRATRVRFSKVRGVRTGSRIVVGVVAPSAGVIELAGPKVVSVRRKVRAKGAYRLTVRLRPAIRRALTKRSRVRVQLKVRFRPRSGRASTATATFTVKAR